MSRRYNTDELQLAGETLISNYIETHNSFPDHRRLSVVVSDWGGGSGIVISLISDTGYLMKRGHYGLGLPEVEPYEAIMKLSEEYKHLTEVEVALLKFARL